MNKETELKVGSTVKHVSRYRTVKTTILGETKTQWKVGNSERRFRKSDLCGVGNDRWEYDRISPWTEEDEKVFQRSKEVNRIHSMIEKLQGTGAKNLSPEQVVLLENILEW